MKKDYAFEELIAEIAVSILGVKRGFKTDLEQSAAKVEGWINAL
ncbi:zincin-like metallopeptidase domain-containing protein [Loktanella sp. D2R18]